MEIWKSIKGYEGLYEISNLGRVKTLPHYVKSKNGYRLVKERILKPAFNQKGYLFVDLCKDGKRKSFRINRLVALSFIPNPNGLPQVNHISEDKTDNRACNLEWVSAKENANWGTRNERMAKSLSIPVCQFDKDGNFLKEWVSSQQVERELGIWHGNIVKCCNGKRNSAGGFKWEYKKSGN